MDKKERKGENQKQKLLYLARIFSQETDEKHGLTIRELIDKLAFYEVNTERKTMYKDIEELRQFGMDIIASKEGRDSNYRLVSREFELPELKLLVDSVQSAKFITDKKSQALIKKLESLVSKHEGQQLQRQVFISGRIKTVNESIYYSVDKIHDAIGASCQIRFQYFQWNAKKQMELRHDGAWYQISPWALLWDDEYYYLVAFDGQDQKIKHYRVDKMLHLSLTDVPREGEDAFRAFDLPRYTKSLFGMFSGQEQKVTLEATNAMAGVLIDRFGQDIIMVPIDDNHCKAVVNVAVSNQFLGWIMALGSDVKITGPDDVVQRMQQEITRLVQQYNVK